MASTVLQVRLDEGTCSQAAEIYEELGMDLQTAVTLFLKRSIKDQGLPFEMSLTETKAAKIDRGIQAIQHMRESAMKAGLSNMTLDEINAEIAAARAERHARERASQ